MLKTCAMWKLNSGEIQHKATHVSLDKYLAPASLIHVQPLVLPNNRKPGEKIKITPYYLHNSITVLVLTC